MLLVMIDNYSLTIISKLTFHNFIKISSPPQKNNSYPKLFKYQFSCNKKYSIASLIVHLFIENDHFETSNPSSDSTIRNKNKYDILHRRITVTAIWDWHMPAIIWLCEVCRGRFCWRQTVSPRWLWTTRKSPGLSISQNPHFQF